MAKKQKKQKDTLPELPKELEVEVFASGPQDATTPRPKLGHIEFNFGREDLNQLRGKINEVIDYLNNL